MATDSVVDLFSLNETPSGGNQSNKGSSRKSGGGGSGGVKAILENLPELWEQSQYDDEYDIVPQSNKWNQVLSLCQNLSRFTFLHIFFIYKRENPIFLKIV